MSAIEAIRKRIQAVDATIDECLIRRKELTDLMAELGHDETSQASNPVMEKTVVEGREVKPPAVGKPRFGRYDDDPRKSPTYHALSVLAQHPNGLTSKKIKRLSNAIPQKYSLTGILSRYATMRMVDESKIYTINQAGLNRLKNMPTESENGATTTPART